MRSGKGNDPAADLDSGMAAAEGDAFGWMLRDAQRGGGQPGAVYELTERDDGHLSVRDACYYFDPVAPGSPGAVLLDTVRGRVLDVGCGAGRHLQLLAAQGIAVLGIDVSPGAVQVCTERSLAAVCGSILSPPSLGQFDVFLLLGGNLGLLASPSQAGQLLDALGRLAVPGARIIAEGLDLSCSNDPVHRAYQNTNRDHGRHPVQVRMRIRYRNLASAWTSLWFPPPAELPAVAQAHGWQVSAIDSSGPGPGFRAELVREHQ